MNFELNKLVFLYGDYEYFQWFAKKKKENLIKVIEWKRLRRGKPRKYIITHKLWCKQKQDIDENAIKNLDFGIVTRAFLFHLKWPTEYPIFDSNVSRAMMRLEGDKEKEYTTSKKDYERYITFFEKYYVKYKRKISIMNLPKLPNIDQEIIKRKVLDRALWQFGGINGL